MDYEMMKSKVETALLVWSMAPLFQERTDNSLGSKRGTLFDYILC